MSMAEATELKDITIKDINHFQYNAIKKLFDENNWDLDTMIKKDVKEISNTEQNQLKDTQFHIPPNTEKQKCPYCFCQPCIIDENNRQEWWGSAQTEPKIENCGKRKRCYKKF